MAANVRKLGKLLDTVFMAICILLLAVIIVASSLQVFTRYIMGNAVTGTEELGRYCFIWMSMLGGSICVGKWLHPSISILTDALGPGMRRISDVVLNILIAVVAGVLLAKGGSMVLLTTRQLSSVLRIPMCFVYLGVPLGAFGMGYHAVENLVAALHGGKGKEEPA